MLKEAAHDWVGDNAMRLSASLAYYAIFSLAPLMVIILAIAGLVFGQDAAQGQLSSQIRQLAGDQAGNAVQTIIQGAGHKSAGVFATIFGLVVLLFGASGVFGELKNALNTIWGVAIKPGRPWYAVVRDRFLSFGMVLGIGFLLLISLTLSAVLSALGTYMRGLVPMPHVLWAITDFLISFVVVGLLFAMMFRFLPNVKIRWRDVWVGALGTSVLFSIGKTLIGLYLGTSTVASSYGAAGSVIILLLWIYYSACILFFGAEYTKVYARRTGAPIVPSEDAMLLKDALKEKPR